MVQQACELLSNDDLRLAYDSTFTTKTEEQRGDMRETWERRNMRERRKRRRERLDLIASAAVDPEAANGSITQGEPTNQASTASIFRWVREREKELIRQRTEMKSRYAVEELSSYSSSFESEDDSSTAYRGFLPVAPKRSYFSPPERRKLQRANSSTSMDHSMRKMHHSMGSDYGGSDDEGAYTSLRTYRSRPSSRPSSRQRSHSRNQAHSDAYAPPGRPQFSLLDDDDDDDDDDDMLSSSKSYFRSNKSLFGRPKRCRCCLKRFRPDDIVSVACQHLWCPSCLSRLVQLGLDSAELWPPKCCSIEISQATLLDNLDESTKAGYQLAIGKQTPHLLKCPYCLEFFRDLLLLLRHHERSHIIPETSPPGNEMVSEKDTPAEQASNAMDVNSNTPRRSISSQASEEISPSTTISEPDPDNEAETLVIGASTPIRPLPVPKKISRQWKIHQLPSIATIFLGKATIHFLGFQTTAWFVLVLAAVATSITTSYSIHGLAPDPRPEIGDSNYYSLLSQSIIAICSLYYLMVPYLRGDKEFPVRALFYICWILSLAGAVAAPLAYSIEWTKSVWCGFGSAIAQVAATAFLFEHTGKHDRKQSHEEKFLIKPASGHEEEEEVEKYTDAVEGDT